MENKKIVMLAGEGISTRILYNALKEDFNIATVILEAPIKKRVLLKKRIRKVGAVSVFGQVLFQLIIVSFLDAVSGKRKKEILKDYDLNDTPIPWEKIIHVNSVNDDETLKILREQSPSLVVVNGTRIISGKILNSVPAKFINIHAGITPKYRGVHGGYWALASGDPENFGTTVHLVDQGIDTGNILYQKKVAVSKKDNFVTYPVLQLAEAIPYIKTAINDIFSGNVQKTESTIESRLWYHPAIWTYIYNFLKKGVR